MPGQGGRLVEQDITRIVRMLEDRLSKKARQEGSLVVVSGGQGYASANRYPNASGDTDKVALPKLYDQITIADNATETLDICQVADYGGAVLTFLAERNGRWSMGEIRVWSTSSTTGDAIPPSITGGNPNMQVTGDTVSGTLQLSIKALTEGSTPDLNIALTLIAYLNVVTP